MTSITDAVTEVLRNENIGHYFAMAKEDMRIIFSEYARPSAVFRPNLTKDGNAWLAVYGDLPTGVVGTGTSPEEAMFDFDKNWSK